MFTPKEASLSPFSPSPQFKEASLSPFSPSPKFKDPPSLVHLSTQPSLRYREDSEDLEEDLADLSIFQSTPRPINRRAGPSNKE